MEIINEDLHVVDPKKVTILVDNLIKFIKEEIELYILENNRFLGKETGRECAFAFVIQEEDNPCSSWLSLDNEYHVRVHFYDEYKMPTAKFSPKTETRRIGGEEIKKVLGYVSMGDESIGISRKIHLGMFNIELFLDPSVVHDGFEKDFKNKFVEDLRGALEHEITHAYREMFLQLYFKRDINEVEQNEHLTYKQKEFKDAYNKIIDLSKAYASNKPLAELLGVMYIANYMERDAFTSQFYSNLVDTLRYNDKLRPITDYFSYNKYANGLKIIQNFNDPESYKAIVHIAMPLFGKACSDFKTFKRRISKHIKDTLYNMQSIYDSMNSYGLIRDLDERIKSAQEKYFQSKEKTFPYESYKNYENMPIYEVLRRDYMKTEIDMLLNMIILMFKEKGYCPGQRIPAEYF